MSSLAPLLPAQDDLRARGADLAPLASTDSGREPRHARARADQTLNHSCAGRLSHEQLFPVLLRLHRHRARGSSGEMARLLRESKGASECTRTLARPPHPEHKPTATHAQHLLDSLMGSFRNTARGVCSGAAGRSDASARHQRTRWAARAEACSLDAITCRIVALLAVCMFHAYIRSSVYIPV